MEGGKIRSIRRIRRKRSTVKNIIVADQIQLLHQKSLGLNQAKVSVDTKKRGIVGREVETIENIGISQDQRLGIDIIKEILLETVIINPKARNMILNPFNPKKTFWVQI